MKKAISATLVFTLSSSIGAFTNNAIIRRRHNYIIINDHKKSSSLNLIINSDLNNNNNNNDEVSQRRAFLRNITGAAFGTTMGLLVNQEPASATYSAYANREKDWQQRQEKGGKYFQFILSFIIFYITEKYLNDTNFFKIH